MIWAVGELKVGIHTRTKDGIGYIFDHEGDRYQVVSMERDEERDYSANELTPWLPAPGERVVEADNDARAAPAGIVVQAGERTSIVKWEGSVIPQTWLNANLEPAACD
jgi:hypothetical protein